MACRGYGYMSVRHVKSTLVTYDAYGLQDVVKIVQRLSHAHEHNVVDPVMHDESGCIDLPDDFFNGEAANKSHPACNAEAAAHPAPDLGGDAQGGAAFGRDNDGFDDTAVGEGRGELYNLIFLPRNDPAGGQGRLFGKPGGKCGGAQELRRFDKRSAAFFENLPVEHCGVVEPFAVTAAHFTGELCTG